MREFTTLEGQARLCGAYAWFEHRLWEVTGHWSLQPSLPVVQLLLDEEASVHAAHAAMWEERLPRVAHIDRAGLVRPPDDRCAAVFAALDVPSPAGAGPAGGSGGVLVSLSALVRVVLPRLAATYRRHLGTGHDHSDGPVMDALERAIAGTESSRQAGETLLEQIVTRPHDLSSAQVHTDRVESLVLEASGGEGLFDWGTPAFA